MAIELFKSCKKKKKKWHILGKDCKSLCKKLTVGKNICGWYFDTWFNDEDLAVILRKRNVCENCADIIVYNMVTALREERERNTKLIERLWR